jgi:hypothetical protein
MYCCEKCNYSTPYLSRWKSHLESSYHQTGHRKIRKDRQLEEKCKCCEYKTNNITNMKYHYLQTHATEEERLKEYKYYCSSCLFGTFSKSVYEKHIETVRHHKLIKNSPISNNIKI